MPTTLPIVVATIFRIWGQTVDIIKHVRFQVNRSGISEPQVAENDHHHRLGYGKKDKKRYYSN